MGGALGGGFFCCELEAELSRSRSCEWAAFSAGSSVKKSLRSSSSNSCSWKALALGEVELRGLAILTSICLAHPLGAEDVLFVVADDGLGAARVAEGHEAVAAVDLRAAALERQQDVDDLAELREVVAELLCLADRA